MIKSKLLFRYLIFGVLISCIFLFLIQLTTNWLRDFSASEEKRFRKGPFNMVSTLLDRVSPTERVELFQTLRVKNPNDFVANSMLLLDADHQILFPLEKKGNKYEVGENDQTSILQGNPQHILVQPFFHHRPPPPPPGAMLGFNGLYLIQTAAMFAAVLLTVIGVIWSLRDKASLAENVINELHRGNLKARFPIGTADEIGQVMLSFNKMADEIEHLVESLRKTEASRRNLLRELAHDLRTPIASMQSMIETVADHEERLGPEKSKTMLKTVLQETKYFSTLVDDLLFLGRVEEPGYRHHDESLELSQILQEEAEAVSRSFPKISYDFDCDEKININGNQQLLRRMIRNVLENAFSFAESKVILSLKKNQSLIHLTVQDDGSGFSETALKEFGHKKFSREYQTTGSNTGHRISIGLGSVIVKSVVDAHRGRIEIKNQVDQGEIRGAVVHIVLS